MKKIFTLCALVAAFVFGTTQANAQSKIPGKLDLSTTTVEQGDGPALHGSAGWNGTNIDWMQTGQKAIIQFENTQAISYNITYRAGSPNANVTITFDITDANGTNVYTGTSNVKVGGWGDKTLNSDLPATNTLPVGNYTLTLTFNNPEGNTTANVYEIEFADANAKTEEPQPGTAKGLNIPGLLDSEKAVITKNCSWGSTPSVDDNNNFNYIGDGDVVTFAITNTKTSAYAISFDTATPCEPVTLDFLITDANGNTVYGATANVVRTGDSGGDWAFKPEGHNTSLPNTDVLPAGNYTLQVTFHQGINYENFTTNLKDITFEAVEGGTTPVAEAKSVFLGGSNLNVDNSTPDLYQFDNAEGFSITMASRGLDKQKATWTDPDGVIISDYINIKNNDPLTINVPEGKKIYALEIGGTAQSADRNQNYIYTIDVDGANWFTDAIGSGIKDDATITSSAKYPIKVDGNGPRFALLDFTAAPAAKSVTITCSGNVQQDSWFKLYITEEDANAVLGKGSQPAAGTKVLYAWKGGENGATETGGKAVATDGESVNYANAGNWTIRINKKKADIATDNVTITLDEALAEGDEIAITGYRNKDNDANGTLYMLFENGAEIDEGSDVVWNNINAAAGGKEPNTRTWTVAAEAGSKTIQIARSAASTNVFITEIKITRAGGSEEPQPLNIRFWDFTKWSDATVANLKADAAASKTVGWSDVEKKADAENDAAPTDISKDNAFWFDGEIPADGQLTANGVVIEETKGLIFQSEIGSTRNLAIAVNYPETSLGTYAGPSYLWLGGSNRNYFEIPDVKAGESIYIELESHKPTDARGITLLQNGTEIDTFTPTTMEGKMWTIPADGNVLIKNTNGCHIYTIRVGAAEDLDTGVKAIETVSVRPANNYIYNLRGQRVDASYKGIVIINGKKVVLK